MKKRKVVNKKLKTAVKSKQKKFTKLTSKEYSKALQHPKWQRKRLRVMDRDNWKCMECGDTETTLHVHHKKYTKKYPWNELMKNLTTLCKRCHFKKHKYKR